TIDHVILYYTTMAYYNSLTRFSSLFISSLPQHPKSPLFPYTTLFRSSLNKAPNKATPKNSTYNNQPNRATAMETIPQVLAFLEADRKSTRLNSSHVKISYAVFCLKKKTPKI